MVIPLADDAVSRRHHDEEGRGQQIERRHISDATNPMTRMMITKPVTASRSCREIDGNTFVPCATLASYPSAGPDDHVPLRVRIAGFTGGRIQCNRRTGRQSQPGAAERPAPRLSNW